MIPTLPAMRELPDAVVVGIVAVVARAFWAFGRWQFCSMECTKTNR
jgi:hypothetical protein